jgi:hypothetical protein
VVLKGNKILFMENSRFKILNHNGTPYLHASLILGLSLVMMVVAKIAGALRLTEINSLLYWGIAGTCLLLFGMLSSMHSLKAVNMNQYWFQSTSGYIGLMLFAGLLAYLFSGISIMDAGFFKFIFMVVTFGYLSFLSIMRFVRKIVEIAKKEDDRWEKR